MIKLSLLFLFCIIFTNGCSLSGRTQVDDWPVGAKWEMVRQWDLQIPEDQLPDSISLSLDRNGTLDSTWRALRRHGKYEINRKNKTLSLELQSDGDYIVFQYNVQSAHLTLSYIGLLYNDDSELMPYGDPYGFVMKYVRD